MLILLNFWIYAYLKKSQQIDQFWANTNFTTQKTKKTLYYQLVTGAHITVTYGNIQLKAVTTYDLVKVSE